ncbi:MAG: nucleotidyltransferase [Planctomycetota bacterium]
MASPDDISSLIVSISSDLTRRTIRHAVSGAAAMAAHGYVRATRDIDILVVAPSTRWPEIFETIRRHGFQGEDLTLIRALRERYVASLTSDWLSVEVLIPVLPYHHDILQRAVIKPVSGTPVPFVALEDLIVLKLLWGRTKDIADVEALLALSGQGLDLTTIRSTLRAILPDDDERHSRLERLVARFHQGG